MHAMDVATTAQKIALQDLLAGNAPDKIEKVLQLYKVCKVDEWATALKEKYIQTALKHLEDAAVISARKKSLRELADYLIQREY